VSLMVWGFLLGPAGAILAVPLTLSLKKFIDRVSNQSELDERAAAMTSAA
jgi:predicted PurR-regulated permease PerM